MLDGNNINFSIDRNYSLKYDLFNLQQQRFVEKAMKIIVFYDDLCPICRTEMHAFAWQYPNEIELVALSTESERLQHYGIRTEDALMALRVVDELGHIHQGLDAVRLLYRRFGKQRLAQLSMLPLLKPVLEWAYPVFVHHRHRVPVWLLGKNARLHCAQGYCRCDLNEKLQHIRSLKH